MTSDSKPRESKIIHDQYIATVYSEAEFDSVQNLDTTGEAEVIHVIEYSAYDSIHTQLACVLVNNGKLQTEVEALKKERDEMAEKWRITEDTNETLKKELAETQKHADALALEMAVIAYLDKPLGQAAKKVLESYRRHREKK